MYTVALNTFPCTMEKEILLIHIDFNKHSAYIIYKHCVCFAKQPAVP